MLSDVEAMSTNHSGKGLTRYAIITFAEYSKIFMKFDSKHAAPPSYTNKL